MSWRRAKLSEVLKQYRFEHLVQDENEYGQVTISKHTGVRFRGKKRGKEIGRKRQFIINLDKFPNTLLFVRQGVEDGAIGLAPKEVNGCITTENMPMFSVENIKPKYLEFVINSPQFKNELSKIQTTGSAQKSIHERQLLDLEIDLPSLEEQDLIVKEISEFRSKQGSISTELNYQLVLVKKLWQAYLREAMQGKLVPQDERDEPAEILLEKIKAKKEKLAAEKGIKRGKSLPPINAEEIPFEVPLNWTWCRGEIVADYIDPQPSHRTPPVSKDGIPYIAMSDIKAEGRLDFDSARKVSFEVLKEHQKRYKLKAGDFIFGKIGTIGKPVLLPQPFNYTLSANVILIQPKRELILDKYLFFFLSSPIAEKELKDKKSTTSYPVFGMGKARYMPIPLPPLAEQERIVTELERLMNICDELERNIHYGREQTESLLQVSLKEALAA